jgi:hypothetical protein
MGKLGPSLGGTGLAADRRSPCLARQAVAIKVARKAGVRAGAAACTRCGIFGRIDNLADERYAEVFGFPVLGRAPYGGQGAILLGRSLSLSF